jgi:hypothetical protein
LDIVASSDCQFVRVGLHKLYSRIDGVLHIHH